MNQSTLKTYKLGTIFSGTLCVCGLILGVLAPMSGAKRAITIAGAIVAGGVTVFCGKKVEAEEAQRIHDWIHAPFDTKESPDPLLDAAINLAWQTGRPVFGQEKPDGSISIDVVPWGDDKTTDVMNSIADKEEESSDDA